MCYQFVINCSWIRLIRTRFFRILRYFKLQTISLGFFLQSCTIGYFELPLFRTSFRFPCEFEIQRRSTVFAYLIAMKTQWSVYHLTHSTLGLFLYKTKLGCGYICIISILQLGSAYSLYSGYHSYKILADYKKEHHDDPTDLPVDEKYFNSTFFPLLNVTCIH